MNTATMLYGPMVMSKICAFRILSVVIYMKVTRSTKHMQMYLRR